LAADAEGYKYIVWDFNGRFAILSPKPYQLSSFVAKERLGTKACYHSTQRKSCFHQNCRPRTRASVRRASGLVQIGITLLINPDCFKSDNECVSAKRVNRARLILE
jgi:hypothetical protein